MAPLQSGDSGTAAAGEADVPQFVERDQPADSGGSHKIGSRAPVSLDCGAQCSATNSTAVVMSTQPPIVRATGQRSAWKPSTRSIVARCVWSATSR